MTVSLEQKVDFLLKKLGYSVTKTGLAEDESLSGTKKAPFAEAIASPLVVPNTSIWQESGDIPATPPVSSTSVVSVYGTTSSVQMTADPTVTGNRTFIAHSGAGNSSSPILGDWVDVQFGSDYIVNVYKGDPNSGGVKLSASGSGSGDSWFFDYSAGVLNFNGDNVPSGVNSSNIYIVAYRYIGAKGVSESSTITNLAENTADIDLIQEKLISLDERVEKLLGLDTLLLRLEDQTPETASLPSTSFFIDENGDSSTTTFGVTLDPERGVYALDGIPQPTVQVPRGDIIKFNISALSSPTEFKIYKNGTQLTQGVSYGATEVTVDTGNIPAATTKIFYRNSLTSGLGWIIEVTDT
tara:strand:+ start:1673 stop:2734 length:1062 start_codon:yes stop_codon:yes gene_type:complete